MRSLSVLVPPENVGPSGFCVAPDEEVLTVVITGVESTEFNNKVSIFPTTLTGVLVFSDESVSTNVICVGLLMMGNTPVRMNTLEKSSDAVEMLVFCPIVLVKVPSTTS